MSFKGESIFLAHKMNIAEGRLSCEHCQSTALGSSWKPWKGPGLQSFTFRRKRSLFPFLTDVFCKYYCDMFAYSVNLSKYPK